jgi:protein SCO1/2
MKPLATRALLIGGIVLAAATTMSSLVLMLAPPAAIETMTKPSAVGGPFRLVDQNGTLVTEADLKGRPSLLFFGFTHCPDICPTALFEVTQVLEQLGPDAARIGVYFVTVDPERDTPALLKTYLQSFHPTIRGLSGDAAATEQIVRAYRVYARKVPLEKGGYTMDHTAVVYLMDRNGAFVAPFNLKREPSAAASDLRRYL